MTIPTKKVFIPAKEQHEGFLGITVELPWVCPKCGEPRGEVFKTRSYDGSRILNVDGWKNPCGHIDYYKNVRQEYKQLRGGR